MIHAYVDETGDRGLLKGGSSLVFGMSAVLVEDGFPRERLNDVVKQLHRDFNVPADKVMSWKAYLKTYERRRHAAEVLAQLEGVQVLYVYADKRLLKEDSYAEDRERFYNYVAGKMLKSIVWAATYWPGGSREVSIKFGHVRGHDHNKTSEYFKGPLRAKKGEKVQWNLIKKIVWVSADKYLGSEAADIYCGFLKSATWPSKTSWGEVMYFPEFLQTIWHQVRKGSEGCAIPLGMFPMPNYDAISYSPVVACVNCKKGL